MLDVAIRWLVVQCRCRSVTSFQLFPSLGPTEETIDDDHGAGSDSRTWASVHDHVSVGNRLTALGAADPRLDVVSAAGVVEVGRRSVIIGRPTVSPRQKDHEGWDEVSTLLGEHVVVADRMVLVRTALKYTVFDQRLETLGEDLARDAEVALDVVESPQAHRDSRDDEGRPPLADDVERASERAVEVGEARALHDLSLAVS